MMEEDDCDEALRLIGEEPDGWNQHCTSCHQDQDYGYEMCNIELPDRDLEVCCAVKHAWTKAHKP